jgi:hypothetical protein
MKTVREVAIEIPNKPGALSNIIELLGANGIYALGLNIHVSGDQGNLKLVTSDPSRTQNILESAGFSASINDRIVVETPQHPGALTAILKPLKAVGVNLENMYHLQGAFSPLQKPLLVLAVDDNAKAFDALSQDWIKVKNEDVLNY